MLSRRGQCTVPANELCYASRGALSSPAGGIDFDAEDPPCAETTVSAHERWRPSDVAVPPYARLAILRTHRTSARLREQRAPWIHGHQPWDVKSDEGHTGCQRRRGRARSSQIPGRLEVGAPHEADGGPVLTGVHASSTKRS